MKKLFLLILLANHFLVAYDQVIKETIPQLIEKVYLHTDRTYYYPGDDIWFKAYLIDAFDRLLSNHSENLHVELISPSQQIISGKIIKLNGGLGNGDFKLPGNLSPGKYRLRAYTNYMRNFSDKVFFNKEIKIISSTAVIEDLQDKEENAQKKIELGFFPESGSLVDNVPSVVAFKAVDAEGKGCDVTGTVYSSSGEMVTMFQCTHLGMGSFELKPVSGLRYYAIVKGPDNTEVRTDLPKSFSSGVTLSASLINNKELSVIVRTNDPSLSLLKDKNLKLAVIVRNEVVKTISLRIKSLSNNLKLPVDDIPDGIFMLTLMTAEDLPLAERLIFIQHEQNLKVNIQPDKKVYKQRDLVSVKISISGDSIDQQTAFLSFTAAESNFADNIKEYPTTIASWFLLESDIRGTVEGPSYYFDPSNPGRLKDLDLLLLTQGWRDFSWKTDTTEYYSPETGFFVSGRLRKINRDKPLTDPKIHITIFQGENIINETVPADSSGRYHLGNIDISGDAWLVASAVDRKGHQNGLLLLDSMKYFPAEISGYIPVPGVVKKEEALEVVKDYEIKEMETKLEQEYKIKESIKKKYRLTDTIPIAEVTITEQKPRNIQEEKVESVRWMYGEPDNEVIVTPEKENLSVPELLSGIAGVYGIKIRSGIYSGKDPLLLIDGIKRDIRVLNWFPVSLIDRIDVLKSIGNTAVYGLEGNFGVISIITRSGNRVNKETVPVTYTINTKFSGYNSPRIFYSPRHDPGNQSYNPDLRTTLFWKPDISLHTGKELLLDYFNADNSSSIRIIVEGITSTGIPVTSTTEYEVIQ